MVKYPTRHRIKCQTLYFQMEHTLPSPDSKKYYKNDNHNIHNSKPQLITLTNEKDKYRVTQYIKKET